MKKLLLLITAFMASYALPSFGFTDNFDSYTVNQPLGPQSPVWTTWSGVQGGTDDLNVTNTSAHSGTNSLYFTSTSASGGPADIVLPFGGPFTTGNFTFTTWFKTLAGKGGYFNVQGTNTNGQLYTLSVFMNPDGSLEVFNSKALALATTYTQNAWFEFRFEANLNTNTWELFLDGTSKGTFQCADFSIASIDYFATGTTDAFYVDDVSFNHTPYSMPSVNGALSYLYCENGIVTQTRRPDVIVRNLGTTPITSFQLNMTINGTNSNQNFTGLNIASGAAYTAVLTNSFNLVNGLNTITASVANVNGSLSDGDATDDSKTFTLTPVLAGQDKLVIGEEATGTWCGWCPRGAVALKNMEDKYDGFFQGIAVHNGDPMVDSIYDTGIGTKIGGYPSMLVDRLTDIDPSQTLSDFITRIQLTPVGKIKNGAQYNSSNGQLDVSLSTTFNSNVTGNYRIACVIVEDSVKSTASGYAQANYYSGGANGVMGGFETLSNPVPASQMQYDHVARKIAPSFDGLSNAFQAPINSGNTYIHNFTFSIGSYNKNKIHIVGMLIAPDGKIENGSSTTIDAAIANGYVVGLTNQVIEPSILQVYPNPAGDQMNLQINANEYGNGSIQVIDLNGKVVLTSKQTISNGVNIIPIRTAALASGSYLVVVNLNGKHHTIPFNKQ